MKFIIQQNTPGRCFKSNKLNKLCPVRVLSRLHPDHNTVWVISLCTLVWITHSAKLCLIKLCIWTVLSRCRLFVSVWNIFLSFSDIILEIPKQFLTFSASGSDLQSRTSTSPSWLDIYLQIGVWFNWSKAIRLFSTAQRCQKSGTPLQTFSSRLQFNYKAQLLYWSGCTDLE